MKLCKLYNINFIKRPPKLSKDKIEKQDVIVHAYKKLKKKFKPKIIVSLQANSPEFKVKHLDSAIKFFKKIFLDKKIKEVITIDKQKKIMNGAFRIMMPDGVAKKTSFCCIHDATLYSALKETYVYSTSKTLKIFVIGPPVFCTTSVGAVSPSRTSYRVPVHLDANV